VRRAHVQAAWGAASAPEVSYGHPARAHDPQVASIQQDLKVEQVWENVWGVVQLVFLPGGKVMTVHKTGELRVYDSINKKATVRAAPFTLGVEDTFLLHASADHCLPPPRRTSPRSWTSATRCTRGGTTDC
jgi:hypothetical protein